DLPVFPRLTFRRISDGAIRTLDPGAMGMPPLDFHTTNGHWVDQADPILQLLNVAPGRLVDGDCDPGTAPAGPLQGTSNFHPGIRVQRDGSGCAGPPPGQHKRLSDEDAMLAAHG